MISTNRNKQIHLITKNENSFFEGKVFIPMYLAREILKKRTLISDGTFLYNYENGVYKLIDENIIRRDCMNLLGKKYTKFRANETIHYILVNRLKEINDMHIDYINVLNGLLDWKNKKLLPHDSKRYSTIQLPIIYDPTAKCNNIENFLKSIVPVDTIPMIEEWFGYNMLPITKYEKALMLTGTGSNGKSKFIQLFEKFIGTENISNIPLQDLEHNRFKLAQLRGKLANTFADIPSNALEKSSVFKTVVSGDRTNAEYKGVDSFSFQPFARLIFSANELPRSSDLTYGFFRRWLVIPFPYTFGGNGKKADPNILDKITTKEELSGLLNLAITGLNRLENKGSFTLNESTIDALDQYRREIDNVAVFIEECCIVGEKEIVEKQDLFFKYDRWCSESGYKPLGKIKFYKRIESLINVVLVRPNAKEGRLYKGIGLIRSKRYK